MSKEARLKLYTNAVPLTEAWEVFATPEQRTALAGAKGFLEAFANAIAPKNEIQDASEIFKSINAGVSAKNNRDMLILEMQNGLLDALFNSDLIALGVRRRPSKGYYPVKIEAAFFNFANANWAKSTVEDSGTLYADVRIYDPFAPNVATPAKPRKGSIEAIDHAITELVSELPGFCRFSRKSACQLVRDKLGQEPIPGNGLSNQNLEKRIVAQCGPKRITK